MHPDLLFNTEIEFEYGANVEDKGEFNFVTEISEQLPLWVLCEMMGIPESERPKIRDLVNNLTDASIQQDPNNSFQIWVNYMEKHEFNPMHNHSGFLSFVIWNKIPFDVEEEMKLYPDVANNMCSFFAFIHGSPPQQFPIKISKEMQNYICMFPSNLNHCVYPFYTSDDYRVSFAGNIFLRNNK